jgi:hypothetical protein
MMDYRKFDNTAYESTAGKVLFPDAPFIAVTYTDMKSSLNAREEFSHPRRLNQAVEGSRNTGSPADMKLGQIGF